MSGLTYSERFCPVCRAKEQDLLYPRRFLKLSGALIDGYNVVSCRECGFCFASNLPEQSAFDAYYEAQSKYEHGGRGGAPSEYDTRRLPFAVGIISEWLPDRQARILDIGCANGGLLAELKKNGYSNLQGVDPSPACSRTARELYDIKVTTAPISRIPASIGSFDLVIFGSVLEHIIDFESTINQTKDLLKEKGCIYVEIPDMTRCSLMTDAPFQEFSVEHVNYFGPASLRNLMGCRGFAPIGLRQTSIEQVAGLKIYEIKAMFEQTGARMALEKDIETRPELERYIAKSRQKLDRVVSVIDRLVEEQRPIVVWGVGTHTQGLLADTSLKRAKIEAYVDSNQRYVGQSLEGTPILPVEALKRFPHDILVSSQQFQSEIVEQIRNRLALPNHVITLY
ncbi:MAG: class I SAM-dependent methyltransferase [Chthoniobacterales bacterium]|nr:class I SAM-dependent methyltransferase [Chthoniobacterales bacterium]